MVKALILTTLLLAGCATVSQPVPGDPRQIWCDTNTPRRPSLPTIEAMTRSEIDDLNTHNAKGAAWCRWTP